MNTGKNQAQWASSCDRSEHNFQSILTKEVQEQQAITYVRHLENVLFCTKCGYSIQLNSVADTPPAAEIPNPGDLVQG